VAALLADSAPEIDQLLDKVKSANPAIKWAFENGQWVLGAASPRELLRKLLDYNLSGGIAEKITCPTLVLAGKTDLFLPGDPRPLRPPARPASVTLSRTAAPAITAPPFPARPGKPAGRTQGNARSAHLADPVRGPSVPAVPVRGRPCKADGPPHRSHPTDAVRYLSVDTATQRPTALQGDTR
jgi:hypothetical protein